MTSRSEIAAEETEQIRRPEPERTGRGASPFIIVLALLVAGGGFLAFYLLDYLPQQHALESAHNDLVAREHERDRLRARVAELEQSQHELQTQLTELRQSTDQLGVDRDRALQERDSYRARQQQTAAALAELEQAQSRLRERLAAELASGDAEVHGEHGGLSVALGERVLFPLGSADLNDRGREVLTSIASSLNDTGGRVIRVEGHTDATPITGESAQRFPSNWELSTTRATTVVRFLEGQGIPGGRLVAVGYGPYHPLDSNRTAVGRRRNRRIEIVLADPH